MTPEDALIELLDRVAALQGASTLFNTAGLAQWPSDAVSAMIAQKLITKVRPASSVVCPGCEDECTMPVHTIPVPSGDPALFVVCDKRSDTNRVEISPDALAQWQATGNSIANLLARLLGLRRSNVGDTLSSRWEIGVFKGAKHSSHLVLLADDKLTLTLAGHSIALVEVLVLEGDTFKVDKRRLTHLVDQPVTGAGDIESAVQRRERIKKRVQDERAKGTKAFLKVVAEEEGISITRLKQLTKDDSKPDKPSFTW
ncbi:MAG: hypothetical protein RPU12_11560 [Candidatus Sedimenticola sp. (ex Thyasira tokunagai)]